MNIIDKLQWRYATKSFDATKLISGAKLNTIYEAFNLTATSYGLQPLKLVVVSNKPLQDKLVRVSMNQQQVAQASHVLVFCIETTVDKAYIENYFNRVKSIRHTPDEILAGFKDFLIHDFETKPKEAIALWATKQAYLAMGNLLTVCAIEGIDACPMEGFEPSKYDDMLALKAKGLQSVLVMPIGYRADNDMFAGFKKVRKPLQDSIIVM
ncbi:NAD(P)H-dependent oxidoreductase [Pontimicrobium sp. MEBiC06410]